MVLVNAKWAPLGLQWVSPSFGCGRERDFDLGSFGIFPQGQRSIEDGVVQSVGLGVDSQAGEAQHRARQFGNRWIAQGRALGGVVPRGVSATTSGVEGELRTSMIAWGGF